MFVSNIIFSEGGGGTSVLRLVILSFLIWVVIHGLHDNLLNNETSS
jgi:hypothetical protein